MRLGLIADIHANLEALDAVLDDARRVGVNSILCAGDVVGYGPDPGPCIDLVAGSCDAWALGNHDAALVDPSIERHFSPPAAEAIRRTRDMVPDDQQMIVRGLRHGCVYETVQVAHGSFGPHPFAYLTTPDCAGDAFRHLGEPVGVVGHTHIPSAFSCRDCPEGAQVRLFLLADDTPRALPRDARLILNPGSVGQPRDRRPGASWGVLDLDRWTFQVRRVAYDVDAVGRKIHRLGFPRSLGERLRRGA